MNDLGARLATDHDAALVTTTLARAFSTDPFWGDWVLQGLDDRAERLALMFAPFVAAALKHDGAWMTAGGEAVALWVQPGAIEMDAEDEAAWAAATAEVCGERAQLVIDALAIFEQHLPAGNYWYLDLLATDPAHRGRGLGMALVTDRLAAIDAADEATYLESTNPANVARYGAAGFALDGGFDIPAGPHIDTMWRVPRSQMRSSALAPQG